MDLTNNFNGFTNKGWQDKVLEADAIWSQVKSMLAEHNLALPKTPRRPDVRMIVNNISGQEVRFQNPGDHSGSKEEVIPGTGDKCAVMVMVAGETLTEQHKNAAEIYSRYSLGTNGLSPEFINDMKTGKLAGLVNEAYGPAPFTGQAEKLVRVEWKLEDGTSSETVPMFGNAAAYGARAATTEEVFLAQFHIYIKGSTTTAELVESSGMAIAVSEDWQTKAVTTRPIVPSVAKTYYGEHFETMPEVTVHPDGKVIGIDFKTGTTITLDSAGEKTVLIKKSTPPSVEQKPKI